jgi:hypothetical protein
MFIGREGETAAADPSSREQQQQQYAFNKNKYSSRWLEYTIWLCVYRGMKPATIILILLKGASPLFLISCRTQELYLEVELFGLAYV